MGRYYFDQPLVGTPGVPAPDTMNIGPNGHWDYPNYYGAGLISDAIAYERTVGVATHGQASRMQVNLQALGLNEKLMEENGIFIVAGSTASQTFRDTSTTPPTVGRFDHTYDGPNAHQYVPVEPALAPANTSVEAKTLEADLVADPLYRQVQSAVHRLDVSMGRTPGMASDAMAASLFALARESGLQRVDHVVLSLDAGQTKKGENVFVVQGGLMDPTNRIAHMKTTEAVSVVPELSLERAAHIAPAAVKQHDHAAPQQGNPTSAHALSLAR